ncbi:MAG: hypothetical protein Q8N51_02285 [Gammaproteobacteria bacterium]|nr:hypothetical protein [Gammaproteobacteria bacterium]
MCTARVAHRWDLKDAGVILYPVPAGAPQPPPGHGQYPALLSATFSPRTDIWLRSTDAGRAFEWYSLLLNALTPIGCYSPAVGQHGWTWERKTAVASRWSELSYSIPALYEEGSLEAALAAAPVGHAIEDHAYYVGQNGAVDNALVLPRCLDETIVAANALPEEERKVLRRAAHWIKAGERAGDESRSLNYLALVCGLEALSHYGWKGIGAKKGFSQMMHDLLPCYGEVEASAAYLYKLRCALAHDAAVFADDWQEISMESDTRDIAALNRLTWVCRLVVTNWVRSRRGLPLVG